MNTELDMQDHVGAAEILAHVNKTQTVEDAKKQIDAIIQAEPVVLFMKGTKDQPSCGFSSQVVALLRSLEVNFIDIDVLENQYVRQGIKEYSDWPTIPQLYICGEFVGGCDIVKQMYANGELVKKLTGNQ